MYYRSTRSQNNFSPKNNQYNSAIFLLHTYINITKQSFPLPLQNAEYEVIDDSQEHWWKVKDAVGNVGYIPSNYVKPKALLGLERYE